MQPIHAALTRDDTCAALGITVRASAPVLALCCDFDGERWRQRRGEKPCQTVHHIRSWRMDVVVGRTRQTRAPMNPSERDRRRGAADSSAFSGKEELPRRCAARTPPKYPRGYGPCFPSYGAMFSEGSRHQATVGVGAFCSMRFCRFSSAQNSGGIVACMELTLARTCVTVCAPTINAAATSGAAEN
jgi:hypothetical protein